MDRWRDRDEGLTLIETVVALAVFAIVSAALSAVILNTTALSRNNRSRVVAASLATGELETAREEAGRRSVVTLEQGSTSSTRAVGETTYAIRRTATWTKTTATADSCTTAAGATDNAYLRVSVDVTWPRMNGAAPVHADTLLTPVLGTYSYATGNIAVRVTDRDDRGGADHLVTVEKDGTRLTQRTTRRAAHSSPSSTRAPTPCVWARPGTSTHAVEDDDRHGRRANRICGVLPVRPRGSRHPRR